VDFHAARKRQLEKRRWKKATRNEFEKKIVEGMKRVGKGRNLVGEKWFYDAIGSSAAFKLVIPGGVL